MMKFTTKTVLCLCAVVALSTASHAQDYNERLTQIATPIAEIDILHEKCFHATESLNDDVALYKTRRELEHYYWGYVLCNAEHGHGEHMLSSIREKVKEDEYSSYVDYQTTCSKRIKNAHKHAKQLMKEPLEECEDWGI